METNWAAEHIQVIRTLMERSAVYRRALAPIMTYNGAVGSAAAVLGCLLKIESPRAFILYWAAVGGVAVAGSFLLVRRQALRESEPFWSPPTPLKLCSPRINETRNRPAATTFAA